MTTFKPNMITKIVTTGFIGLSTVFGAIEPAKAADFCHTMEGMHFCASYGYVDNMTIYMPDGGVEKFEIVCRNSQPAAWESNGPLSQFEAEMAVTGFCSTRGNSTSY